MMVLMNDHKLELPAGTRVLVDAHQHPYGPCFLTGPGVILENRDIMSRLAGDVLIRFDRGVTGRFKAAEAAALVYVAWDTVKAMATEAE